MRSAGDEIYDDSEDELRATKMLLLGIETMWFSLDLDPVVC
jgi:hypothetical protein